MSEIGDPIAVLAGSAAVGLYITIGAVLAEAAWNAITEIYHEIRRPQ